MKGDESIIMSSNTQKLREVVDHERSILPECFLVGLRSALDAGLSCEQIASFIILATGLYEAMDNFDGDELILRSKRVVEVIKGHQSAVRTGRPIHGKDSMG